MKLILEYWKRRWQSVSFNPISGRGHVRWYAIKPKKCRGWALKFSGCWYGITRIGENLMFLAGATQYPITDTYQCSNVLNGALRRFLISQNGITCFELTYKAYDNGKDPTFDNLDLELTDFFYWISVVWNDPNLINTLKNSWSDKTVSRKK